MQSNFQKNKQNHPKTRKKSSNIVDYFDAPHLYEDKYINAKLDVFLKYRQKQTPLKVLEVLATNQQLLEQKNLILLHCRHQTIPISRTESFQPRLAQRKGKDEQRERCNIADLRQKTKGSCSMKSLSNIFKSYQQSKQESLSQIRRNLKSFSTRINTENIAARRYASCSSSNSNRNINTNYGSIKIDDSEIESIK